MATIAYVNGMEEKPINRYTWYVITNLEPNSKYLVAYGASGIPFSLYSGVEGTLINDDIPSSIYSPIMYESEFNNAVFSGSSLVGKALYNKNVNAPGSVAWSRIRRVIEVHVLVNGKVTLDLNPFRHAGIRFQVDGEPLSFKGSDYEVRDDDPKSRKTTQFGILANRDSFDLMIDVSADTGYAPKTVHYAITPGVDFVILDLDTVTNTLSSTKFPISIKKMIEKDIDVIK